jgi:hypothetical protein
MGEYEAPRFLPLGALPSEGSRSARVAAELGAKPRAVVLRPIPETVVRRTGALEGLRAEARRQAALAVPHLLRLLDVAALEDGWYGVEEHADGISLAALRDGARARGKTVPPLVIARLVADACAGLEAVAPAHGGASDALPSGAPDLAAAIHVGFDGVARFVPAAAGWPEGLPADPARSLGELLRDELAAAEDAGAGRAPEALRLVADRVATEPGADPAVLRAALLR